jgi:hypothetical protein
MELTWDVRIRKKTKVQKNIMAYRFGFSEAIKIV